MEKSEAIKLAVKFVVPLVENKILSIDPRTKVDNRSEEILSVIKDIARGILEIDKKL